MRGVSRTIYDDGVTHRDGFVSRYAGRMSYWIIGSSPIMTTVVVATAATRK
ncbi:hypothetical protein [Candidatus Spongiihabitans sp.]|uniref:hypothetical protein n=1 Tax=Candidatus Spongiihabitans sp. TaxID=3101308 RepID=UPI003C7D285C